MQKPAKAKKKNSNNKKHLSNKDKKDKEKPFRKSSLSTYIHFF